MAFVKTLDILKKCADEKFAVGAFNLNGLDQVSALVKKAEEAGSPILITEPGVIEPYMDFEQIAAVTYHAAKNAKVPVGLHLSHGGDLEQVERACKAGFTSVMYDGSKLQYEENVRRTAEAVKMGHSYGTAVEGELGALPGASEGGAAADANVDTMTDPSLAKDYVKRTGVDILAVSIGNAHGLYKGKPSLDFQRLEQIYYGLLSQNVYLTLHGGTGIPEDHLKRAMTMGIVKVCIYTDMCVEGKKNAVQYAAAKPEYQGNFDVCDMIGEINRGFTDAMLTCMKMFDSVSRVQRSESFDAASVNTGVAVQAMNLAASEPAAKQSTGPVVNTDVGPVTPSDPTLRKTSAEAKQKIYWHRNV